MIHLLLYKINDVDAQKYKTTTKKQTIYFISLNSIFDVHCGAQILNFSEVVSMKNPLEKAPEIQRQCQ